MTGALVATPEDIAWYLSIVPADRDVIESLKTDGKIVVVEKACDNGNNNQNP